MLGDVFDHFQHHTDVIALLLELADNVCRIANIGDQGIDPCLGITGHLLTLMRSRVGLFSGLRCRAGIARHFFHGRVHFIHGGGDLIGFRLLLSGVGFSALGDTGELGCGEGQLIRCTMQGLGGLLLLQHAGIDLHADMLHDRVTRDLQGLASLQGLQLRSQAAVCAEDNMACSKCHGNTQHQRDGQLNIPVRYLGNGKTVAQQTPKHGGDEDSSDDRNLDFGAGGQRHTSNPSGVVNRRLHYRKCVLIALMPRSRLSLHQIGSVGRAGAAWFQSRCLCHKLRMFSDSVMGSKGLGMTSMAPCWRSCATSLGTTFILKDPRWA